MALASDGVFVCNLLIRSVIEPFSSRAKLCNCGMRDASWERVVKFYHQLCSVVDERRCLAQGVSDDRSTGRRTPNALKDVLPVLTAAIVVNEFLVVAVLCNNTLDTDELTIISSCSLTVQAMVTPCLSALWVLTIASIDADGYTAVSNALPFLDAVGNGDFPSLSSWLGVRDLVISLIVLQCPRQ